MGSKTITIPRPVIRFEGIQIKSLEAFKRFAAALTEIEEQTGISEVEVVLKDIFFCPWINEEDCRSTPMERLIISCVRRMR